MIDIMTQIWEFIEIATFLDPRFKGVVYTEDSEKFIELVDKKLEEANYVVTEHRNVAKAEVK